MDIEWSEVGVVEMAKFDVQLDEADSVKLCGAGTADVTGTGANVVKYAGDVLVIVEAAAAKCCTLKAAKLRTAPPKLKGVVQARTRCNSKSGCGQSQKVEIWKQASFGEIQSVGRD